MGVLGSVVAPSTALVAFCDSKIFDSGSIRFEIVRDELIWHKTVFLQKLAHEFQRRPLVPLALDQNIKHFALGINGAPQKSHAAIDPEINLIEVPDGVGLWPSFAEFRRDHWPEMVHPAPNGLIRDRNAAFCQQIFDVTKAQGKPQIEPDRLLDDFGGEPLPFVADFIHALGLLNPRPRPQARIDVTTPQILSI
jgi:hypothetical protein